MGTKDNLINLALLAAGGVAVAAAAGVYRKGSMVRDGSYEATLMFDADEDDPTLRSQRALEDNPYVPQSRPLTAQAQRITSAQGSASRQPMLFPPGRRRR